MMSLQEAHNSFARNTQPPCRTRTTLLQEMNNDEIKFPDDFTGYTRELMGDELYATLERGLRQEPPASIRLNPLKCGGVGVTVAGGDGEVPWCDGAWYLADRPNFTADPLLHAGMYYVQEASSMFVSHVLRQVAGNPVLMLDLCAAPGGKSTAARATLPEGSLLIANEPMRARANILCENVQKFGHPDTIVTNNFPRDFRKAGLMFDVILADVPCSGEGMFRKDEGAVNDWSRAKVAECSALQRDIVSDIWPCLKPGGVLIYSTCTFNADEDEHNAEWIATELGADFIDIAVRPEWNITPAVTGHAPCYRFLPGKTRGEGLFMTVLRKHGEWQEKPRKRRDARRKGTAAKQKALPVVSTLPLAGSADFTTLQHADSIMAVRRQWEEVAAEAMKSLSTLSVGVDVGTMRGKSFVPSQGLALSVALDKSAFPMVDVPLADAISYLRRDAITLPPSTPTGFVVVTFRGVPLGFVKNLGNRCNNLYPAEWRIKSTHLADQYRETLAF